MKPLFLCGCYDAFINMENIAKNDEYGGWGEQWAFRRHCWSCSFDAHFQGVVKLKGGGLVSQVEETHKFSQLVLSVWEINLRAAI